MNNRLGQIVTKIERKKTTCGKVMLPKICKINNFLIFFNVMRICKIFEYLHLNIWVQLLQLVV